LKELINELYDYDQNDQTYIIKIAPDRYLDLFNNLDHYPIRKRDVNQHVVNYIEDCSGDIPLNEKIKIEIKIRDQSKDPDLEERTRKGIKNYFNYIHAFYKQESRKIINNSIIYFIIFTILAILTFSFEALNIGMNKIFLKTIFEGLSIGSWVFLWEAIAGIAIKNKRNRFMMRTYQRLSDSSLYFLYS